MAQVANVFGILQMPSIIGQPLNERATVKRNMELVRQILQRVEENPHPMPWVDMDIPDQTEDEVSYHVMLLAKAGLLEANDLTTSGEFCCKARRLTW